MAISLNGGTGVITGVSVGGLPDGIVDTDMLAAGAVTAAKRGAGAILQVVQSSTSTQVSVSTTSYTDTGLSASITPSSSSNKILVLVNQEYQVSRSAAGLGGAVKLLRDSTTIHEPLSDNGGPFEVYYGTLTNAYGRLAVTKLDSPSSTSSITYKTQGRPYTTANSGAIHFNVTGSNTNGISYITLIEVAG